MAGLETVVLSTWEDFNGVIQKIDQFRTESQQREGRTILPPVFRGLGNSEWGLETTLERAYPHEIKHVTETLPAYFEVARSCLPAIETFTDQRWDGLPETPGDFQRLLEASLNDFGGSLFFSDNRPVYRYLVYLRHHGFPSPFLDWTASPYIAAFFAFDAMERRAESVSIYAMVQDRLRVVNFKVPQISVLGPSIRAHRRHMVQQSRYTICISWSGNHPFGRHDASIAGEEATGAKGAAFKIVIPASERAKALKSLDLMNVNAYSLFGSDDSLIKTIARREALLR